MRATTIKNLVNFLNNSVFGIIVIGVSNLFLRIVFINYSYISTDEGIALYNVRLAYQGLRPFFDYNGWNSLINDYLFGLPQIFLTPTIISQRYFALLISMISFALTLRISYLVSGKRSLVWAALFVSFGSLTYTYFSNLPYSTEMMTLGILLTLLSFIVTSKSTDRYKFWLEIATCVLASITVLIRSQMLPLPIIIWLLFLLQKKSLKAKITFTVRALAIFLLVLLPFLFASWEHTLYGLFWPFSAGKILLYVAHTSPHSLTLLTEYLRVYAQDYGLLTILIISGILSGTRNIKSFFGQLPLPIAALIILLTLFLVTSLIHHPAEAGYMYPAVPLFALCAAFFVSKAFEQNHQPTLKRYMQLLIVFIIVAQFLTYPHFKIMKTQLSSISKRPYDLLKIVNEFVLENSATNDEILTFYLPAVANIDRKTPLVLNEGQGSITILDDNFARKFHLTSRGMLHELISTRRVKLIVFTDTFIYYFGVNDQERQETLKLITQNYVLAKEFTDFKSIDGSKAKSLMIYKAVE